jgi:hypothetical protein
MGTAPPGAAERTAPATSASSSTSTTAGSSVGGVGGSGGRSTATTSGIAARTIGNHASFAVNVAAKGALLTLTVLIDICLL